MNTTQQTTDKQWSPWTPQELAKRCKAAVEQYKKIPGIMKSGPAYMEMVSDYIDAVANAERDGKHLVWHGTQMNTEVYYAMDIVPCFNEMYSVVFSMVGGPVRELYDLSASGNASKTRCTYHRK